MTYSPVVVGIPSSVETDRFFAVSNPPNAATIERTTKRKTRRRTSVSGALLTLPHHRRTLRDVLKMVRVTGAAEAPGAAHQGQDEGCSTPQVVMRLLQDRWG
jgi:hypothetical protein